MATLDSIAYYLLKKVARAVREFSLIAPGDHIAVGVSGGKDSRTLLELLLRGVALPQEGDGAPGPRYRVTALHVDGSPAGLPDLRPTLEPWLQAHDVPYEIVPIEVGEDESLPLDCFRCAWNRRKTLFQAADRLGCNKIAFAHHADDAAVTTLLSLMYKGRLETLAPSLNFFEGRFFVIRPLILVPEAEIARYARAAGWEFPAELDCPRTATTRRADVQRFLHSLNGRERKAIRANLWRAAREAMEVCPTASTEEIG